GESHRASRPSAVPEDRHGKAPALPAARRKAVDHELGGRLLAGEADRVGKREEDGAPPGWFLHDRDSTWAAFGERADGGAREQSYSARPARAGAIDGGLEAGGKRLWRVICDDLAGALSHCGQLPGAHFRRFAQEACQRPDVAGLEGESVFSFAHKIWRAPTPGGHQNRKSG